MAGVFLRTQVVEVSVDLVTGGGEGFWWTEYGSLGPSAQEYQMGLLCRTLDPDCSFLNHPWRLVSRVECQSQVHQMLGPGPGCWA